MKKKRYKRPVLNRVSLDPNQAVIEACKQTGNPAWIKYSASGACTTFNGVGSTTFTCTYGYRGSGAITGTNSSQLTSQSAGS